MATIDKEKLRTVFLRKRKMLSEFQADQLSVAISQRFDAFLSEKKIQNVHLFLPITKQREVNTWRILENLGAKQVEAVISRSDLNQNTLTHYLFESKDQLSVNKWGIPEPVSGKQVDVSAIDMVLVPMVVFDRNGHRIGYGKGYYDRFLSECRPDCIKVGLSMMPPIDIIPYTDPYDIPLDYCVTPLKTYEF
ncbi:5-formyltetrahydrofolate cyclo-ligase [Reichenbachiella ulvae]|uniref:5-formyltetrahydrofolate cyclo-ligase n=1 Tax=Reichenbachiella ulvae TaxID=2980104 RepID=A0ABT3CWE3_9BACT|nr:5-formyltetrahydrofolate cyclo-ligase [Reichenbachiella ulvae]MCV9387947.1 5-formyltetrahydrofolate cyclo-ligase [Reichenbachiella ulvae]